jgi:predicted ester cyclase
MLPAHHKSRLGYFVEEVIHRGNLDALDQFFTPDCVIHDPGVDLQGPVALRQGIHHLRAAFPDLRLTIEDAIAEGQEVAARYRGEGTHGGEWRGISSTGKRISYTGILMVRFEGNRIAEYWAQPDLLGLLQQLGAVRTQ